MKVFFLLDVATFDIGVILGAVAVVMVPPTRAAGISEKNSKDSNIFYLYVLNITPCIPAGAAAAIFEPIPDAASADLCIEQCILNIHFLKIGTNLFSVLISPRDKESDGFDWLTDGEDAWQ